MMGVLIYAFSIASMVFSALACALSCAGSDRVKRMGRLLPCGAAVCLTLSVALRTVLLGRFPLTSGADFVQLFCWFILVMHIVLSARGLSMGVYALAIVVLLQLAACILMPGQLGAAQPLAVALKSPLLAVHVLTAGLAYALFAVAAAMAILLLRKGAADKRRMIGLVKLGFSFLTFTIILGAVWAEEAWGSYWSWDPKETWALITWMIYAIFLHQHRSFSERTLCVLVIAGFCASVFTFLGVSFLLPGLHSYAA